MPPNITIQTYNNSITTSPIVIDFHFYCLWPENVSGHIQLAKLVSNMPD